uniref:Uncharacterized protein n=1 Tax=Romanomermis culicivorax TaxID=13658 RepID=A0A915HIZ0_ROMCU
MENDSDKETFLRKLNSADSWPSARFHNALKSPSSRSSSPMHKPKPAMGSKIRQQQKRCQQQETLSLEVKDVGQCRRGKSPSGWSTATVYSNPSTSKQEMSENGSNSGCVMCLTQII